MDAIKHYIHVDLLTGRVSGALNVQQLNAGHTLYLSMSRGAEPVPVPTGTSIELVYELPDGTKSSAGMTPNGANAYVTIPRAAVTQAGDVECEVRVYDAETGTFVSTPVFTMHVGKAVYSADDMEETTADLTAYEEILAFYALVGSLEEATNTEITAAFEEFWT